MLKNRFYLPSLCLGMMLIAFQNCAKTDFTSASESGSSSLASTALPLDGGTPTDGSAPTPLRGDAGYAFCASTATDIVMATLDPDPGAKDVAIHGTRTIVDVENARNVDLSSLAAVDVKVQRSESVNISNAAANVSLVTRNFAAVTSFGGTLKVNAVTGGSVTNSAAAWIAMNLQNFGGEIARDAADVCLSAQRIEAGSSIHDIAGRVVLVSRHGSGEPNPVMAKIQRFAGSVILENVDADDISDFAAVVILINSHVKHIGRGAAIIWSHNSVVDERDDSSVIQRKF